MIIPASLQHVAEDLLAFEESRHLNPGTTWGIPTGFTRLDKLTGGVNPGLWLLGARLSHGKSAFLQQLLFNVAGHLVDNNIEGKVVLFSPEMTSRQIWERAGSYFSGVPLQRIKEGRASDEQRLRWRESVTTTAEVFGKTLVLIAGEAVALGDIVDYVDDCYNEGTPLAAIGIDYAQIVSPSMPTAPEHVNLKDLANGLKMLSNRRRLPILMATQLNRDIEKDNRGQGQERLPDVGDIAGSDVLARAADAVLLMYRPPEAERSDGAGQVAKMLLRKNKDGPPGDFDLIYHASTFRFENHGKF